MPIYEYKCQKCHKRFEKLQKVSDPPCNKCPGCGGLLKKVISSAAIQFKGSGFYITDYAKKEIPAEIPAKEKKPKDTADAGKKTETSPSDKPCSD
jgi:putative FmdB family regulatory protein